MKVIAATVLLLNSALLFWVEPLIAKLLLPHFGGSASVWNTCVAFFQICLLLGYCYAHLAKRLPSLATLFHGLGLIIVPIITWWNFDTAQHPPTLSPNRLLLWHLTSMIAPAFLLISSHGPLVQNWVKDRIFEPYSLFAASNLGSAIGLLCFPFVLEPFIDIDTQIFLWKISFGLLCALLFALLLKSKPWHAPVLKTSFLAANISHGQRLRWVVFSAVPAALMLSVTSYVTSEVAALPLLWITPLFIYLTTLSMTFSTNQKLKRYLRFIFNSQASAMSWVIVAIPIMALGIGLSIFARSSAITTIVFHFTLFALIALNLHFRLEAEKPDKSELTEFYFWLGLGGAIGGMLIAFVAPILFTRMHEYPLMLGVGIVLWNSQANVSVKKIDIILPLILASAMYGAATAMRQADLRPEFSSLVLVFTPVLLLCLYRPSRLRIGWGILLLLWVSTFFPNDKGWVIKTARSFYGIHRIIEDKQNGLVWLQHGETIHGAQYRDKDLPLTYYSPASGVGDIFQELYQHQPHAIVAVVGLGSGALSFYARQDDQWFFFEIDPVVVQIAQDSRYFSYLARSKTRPKIILGDGRLEVGKLPDQSMDLLVIDAFGSDSVPVHLMTLEAMQLYLSKLKQEGTLVFHTSSRFFDMSPIIGTLTAQMGLTAIKCDSSPRHMRDVLFASRWVVVAQRTLRLNRKCWEGIPNTSPVFAWTDQHSSILPILTW